MAFLKEGPFGDPALNNAASLNDPSVVEWMARSREYVRQAAEKGDREAIGNMSNYYQFVEVDHYKALMYYSASLELMPNSVRQAREITISQTLQLLGRGLTESRANDAVVAGKKLAKVDQ